MTANSPIAAQIVDPRGAAREPALRLALRHLPLGDRQHAIVEALRGESQGSTNNRVLAAERDGRLVGAVWLQIHPGHAASVSPPHTIDGEPAETAVALLQAAADRLSATGINLLQNLLETDSGAEFDRFIAAGFEKVCDLLYLVSLAKDFPTSRPSSELGFLPIDQAGEARLAGIIHRTYSGTMDCPRLNGVRSLEDVLSGYRANGSFSPQRWLVCRREDTDIGCLLLADYPAGNQWELVYMGLVPEARGKGWGIGIVRHGQWLARCAGRARLVLAVDAANRPAIDSYAAAGFLAWDRRSVLMRVLTAGGAAGGSTLS
jgi:mycothiol synthase